MPCAVLIEFDCRASHSKLKVLIEFFTTETKKDFCRDSVVYSDQETHNKRQRRHNLAFVTEMSPEKAPVVTNPMLDPCSG